MASTFAHEEPDRVPLYEGSIEIPELVPAVQRVIAPGLMFISIDVIRLLTAPWFAPFKRLVVKTLYNPKPLAAAIRPRMVKPVLMRYTRLYRRLGVDLVSMAGGMPAFLDSKLFDKILVQGNVVYGPAGDVATKIAGNGAVHRNGFLRSAGDYETYITFDPDNPVNYFLAPHILEAAKGKLVPLFSVFGAAFFENMCEMFGYDVLFRMLVKEPAFVKRVVEDMAAYSRGVAARLLEAGAEYFYITDDLGQKGRPMISPRMYRSFFLPHVKKFCDLVHRGGGKVMMHSDGGVMELVPSFLEAGIDALHPWESAAGMDIFEGKRRWGDKLVLVGNVPIELLSHGTPGEVEAYVQRLMEEVSVGGGHVLSSSHSLVPTCKFENYKAMLRAHKRHGHHGLRG